MIGRENKGKLLLLLLITIRVLVVLPYIRGVTTYSKYPEYFSYKKIYFCFLFLLLVILSFVFTAISYFITCLMFSLFIFFFVSKFSSLYLYYYYLFLHNFKGFCWPQLPPPFLSLSSLPSVLLLR